jgi:hypothetical protein
MGWNPKVVAIPRVIVVIDGGRDRDDGGVGARGRRLGLGWSRSILGEIIFF